MLDAIQKNWADIQPVGPWCTVLGLKLSMSRAYICLNCWAHQPQTDTCEGAIDGLFLTETYSQGGSYCTLWNPQHFTPFHLPVRILLLEVTFCSPSLDSEILEGEIYIWVISVPPEQRQPVLFTSRHILWEWQGWYLRYTGWENPHKMTISSTVLETFVKILLFSNTKSN